MVEAVAQALAKLGARERSPTRTISSFPASEATTWTARHFAAATRTRFAGEAHPLRFHDLRHTFGSLAINKASLVEVQHWLGHHSPTGPRATYITSRERTRRSGSPMPSASRSRFRQSSGSVTDYGEGKAAECGERFTRR